MAANLFSASFYFLLFLLMCGTLLCGHVCASATPEQPESDTVELFQTKKPITIDFNLEGEPELQPLKKVTVTNFYSPVLVLAGNYFFALAGVDRTEQDKKNINVLTKHIKKAELLDHKDNFENILTKWKAQFAEYDNCEQEQPCEGTCVVRGFVAAVNDNKIYLLLVNATSGSAGSVSSLNFWLAKGTVGSTDSLENIAWGVKEKLTPHEDGKFTEQINEKTLSKTAFSGSAFFTGEKKNHIFGERLDN